MTTSGTSPGHRRSRTVSLKTIAREARREPVDPELAMILEAIDRKRPRCRADCEALPRPCLFLGCRYNLFLDVDPKTGSIKFNFPDQEPWELADTCALDVADRGGVTLEEVAKVINVTRERTRQIEGRGLQRLQAAASGGRAA